MSCDFGRKTTAYVRLLFAPRQPLCLIGVTSLTDATVTPRPKMARSVTSRLLCLPSTSTSNVEAPKDNALRTIASIVTCAANGEAFLAPLNPRSPAEVQANTFPRPSKQLAITLFRPIVMRSSEGESLRRTAAIANFNSKNPRRGEERKVSKTRRTFVGSFHAPRWRFTFRSRRHFLPRF